MYNPPTFLTVELLAEIMAERSWPAPYKLVDDLPDSIEILLPRCHLFATEGFESEMAIHFASDSTGLPRHISIKNALIALRREQGRSLPPTPPLINYFSPNASAEKVKNELRDQLTLLFTYFAPSLVGDFEWVAAIPR